MLLLHEVLGLLIPIYLTNALPVLVKGRTPIDGGRLFFDDQPLFGPSKTVEGAAVGIIGGALAAVVAHFTLSFPFTVGLIAAWGAVLGDLLSSFVKRRLHLPSGKPAPLLDAISFLLVPLLLTYPLYIPQGVTIAVALAITPLSHLVSNGVAYLIGVKPVPW